jgi:hypothetical protein
LFLAVLFLIKIGFVFKNPIDSLLNKKSGLAYDSTMTLQDAANKDTDGDGIPDWEESLYGLDPNKKETTPGVPDNVAIQKLIAQNQTEQGFLNNPSQDNTNLTKTDKFSQDLMATITTLNQNGGLDQNATDTLSSSLADEIKNSPPRKVFLISDLKIAKNDTYNTVKTYADTLAILFQKNPTKETILDVLQKFSADENNVDPSVLQELNPNIKQINSFIDGMAKLSVPPSLAELHLNVLNGYEKIVENLNDIQLYDTDPVVALGGITKYSPNTTTLTSDLNKLADAINQILKP